MSTTNVKAVGANRDQALQEFIDTLRAKVKDAEHVTFEVRAGMIEYEDRESGLYVHKPSGGMVLTVVINDGDTERKGGVLAKPIKS